MCIRDRHQTFRGYWDYDGGGLTDMGQHYMDPVQYLLGKDRTSPVKVEVDAPEQHPDAVDIWRKIVYTYDDGCQIVLEGEGFESKDDTPYIEGPLGKVYKGFRCTIPDVMEKLAELPDPEPQNTDFLECVRTRRRFALDEEEEDVQTLPPLTQGQRLAVASAQVASGKTPPPARYTEATLLTAMEHPQAQVADKELRRILEETSGLGTPATRADIIEKLFSAFYIERRGKEIVPTSKGLQLVELAPPDLRSAALTAKWEDRLARIAKGQEQDKKFIDEMRAYATRLVAEVKASDAKYTHDNQTRKVCPDCGKYLLLVKGKRGEMLVCPDRECGYRKSVTQVTNARCPNCFKKMELRGEGENQMFACVCGYREKLSAFQERRKSAGAGKRDVAKYLQQQKDDKPVNSGMADALAKWLEKNQK